MDKVHSYSESDMRKGDLLRFANGTAAVYSARSPVKDTANEDSVALIPYDERSGVMVVADGVGGMPSGDHASRIAVDALVRAVERAARDQLPLREAILDGIEQANRDVQARAMGGATTLALVELDGSTIRSYHVGDSMILVTGQRGKVKQQTVSHSPVGYAVESGLLDENEAVHHEDRHIVSNVVGSSDMRIEIGPHLELAARDTVVLATDGLFDNFYVEEIIGRMRTGHLDDVVQRLANEGRERMVHPCEGCPSKPDDMSFIVFRLAREPSAQL